MPVPTFEEIIISVGGLANFIYIILFVAGAIYMSISLSKFYFLKEVRLAEIKGDRMKRLIGRQIRFSKNPKAVPKKVRDKINPKGMIIVKDRWKGGVKKILIPKDVDVKEKPDMTIIYKSGVKFDYDSGYYIPFSEQIKANAPSEKTYYDEIERKFKETDREVTKATACSNKSKEWHNIFNSIPVSGMPESSEEKSEIIAEIGAEDKGEEKRKAKDNIEKLKDKYDFNDAMEELGGGEI